MRRSFYIEWYVSGVLIMAMVAAGLIFLLDAGGGQPPASLAPACVLACTFWPMLMMEWLSQDYVRGGALALFLFLSHVYAVYRLHTIRSTCPPGTSRMTHLRDRLLRPPVLGCWAAWALALGAGVVMYFDGLHGAIGRSVGVEIPWKAEVTWTLNERDPTCRYWQFRLPAATVGHMLVAVRGSPAWRPLPVPEAERGTLKDEVMVIERRGRRKALAVEPLGLFPEHGDARGFYLVQPGHRRIARFDPEALFLGVLERGD